MQNRVYIITGKRGVGKTTSLNSILGKISSAEYEPKGFRTFFDERNRLILEWKNLKASPIVMAVKTSAHSLKVNLDMLEFIGERLKKENFKEDLFYADEIGFLESLSKNMQEGIMHSLNTSRTALIILKAGNYPFLKGIRLMEQAKTYNLDHYTYSERKKIEREITEYFGGKNE